jgi:hypothetical protein
MCGIVGIALRDAQPVPLEAMRDTLRRKERPLYVYDDEYRPQL